MDIDILSFRNVMVLSPHPDDDALGCSGTIKRLVRRGASVDIVYITNGERLYGEPSDEIARVRIEEAQRASQRLGCRDAIFLGFPDGGLINHKEEVYQRLKMIIEKKRPEVVFSPSLMDYHQDHVATAKIALKLLNAMALFRLVFYEIYETIRFNQLIDISQFVHDKKMVIMSYRKSLYDKPEVYVHACLGLNAQRSIFTQIKGYYEAFLIIDRPIEAEKVYEWSCYKRDILLSP